MRVVTRVLIALGIGVALVALAAAILAWQLPSLQGTITIGDGDVTLRGFDDPDGAGLAFFLAGVAVVGIVVAVVVAVAIGLVVGVGGVLLAVAAALLAVAITLLLLASPLLLVGWLVWRLTRGRRDRGPAPLAIASP